MKNLVFALMFLAACSNSDSAPVVTEPAAPTVEAVPATSEPLFKVGDVVVVDGIPDGLFDCKVVEVGEVTEWFNRMTGDVVQSRSYIVEVVAAGETDKLKLPEVALTKK